MEAQNAAAQTAALTDRLAGAEQDIRFEAARNVQRLRERDKGNSRLRAAAVVAEKHLADAEKALWCKDREIADLRSRGVREKICGTRTGSGGCSRGGANTAGLEFRVFAAAADARSALERCAVAANERRAAAGSALAGALSAAGSEAHVADAAGFEVAGDEDPGDFDWTLLCRPV